ncbi:MAG: HAMP domain-containing protein [Lachnospiraceae bacterium]|nr:HAMP domain-containing protein [Lachnospiraceae bacterium]
MSTEKSGKVRRKAKVNKKKTGKIRNKLLMFIMPTVVLLVLILVFVTISLSKQSLTKMSKAQLESSVSTQAENIKSWMDENLMFYKTVKEQIETSDLSYAKLQGVLDGFYGFDDNTPEGLYVISESGEVQKASESEMELSDPLSSEAWTQGITRTNMDFGAAYKNSEGKYVVTAAGIINSNASDLRVLAANVNLDKMTIIVNSGVKMDGASSFLVDSVEGTILAHNDSSLVGTCIDDMSDMLLSACAERIKNREFSTTSVKNQFVSMEEIEGSDWILVSTISVDDVMADVNKLQIYMMIIGIVAIIIIMIVMILVVNRVVAPLAPMSRKIQTMAGGDFSFDIESDSNDEIGQMGDHVNGFIKSMRSMISSISNESVKLKEQSTRSDEVAKSMSSASETQAGAMSQLNETVDQLAVAVNDIAQNATTLANVVSDTKESSEKANNSMKDTVSISQKGREDMQQLNSAMNDIHQSNEKLVISINKVGDASEQITNIVELIGNIADETSLLSLNASIEAARAGEAGKGFAVVATEIAKLAQTSSESAQNIAQLIDEVRNLIEEVVDQSNVTAQSIEHNSELINTAVETFDQIYANIDSTNKMITDMISGIEQVSDVATNVAAISQEQAASADEILNTSQSMVEQANNINKSSRDVAENAHELSETSETLTSYVQRFKI